MLNDRIKELRKAKRISQIELGEAVGVSKQCVSNWENDNVQPSIEMLVKIALFFNVSTDYLLGINSREYLEITGLTKTQLMHVQEIINDISNQ